MGWGVYSRGRLKGGGVKSKYYGTFYIDIVQF